MRNMQVNAMNDPGLAVVSFLDLLKFDRCHGLEYG